MQIKLFLSLILLSVIAAGCDEESTSTSKVGLKVKGITTASTFNSGRKKAADLEFNQIVFGASEIEFETADENTSELANGESEGEELEFEGEFVIDLIAGTSTPDFGISQVKPGLYEEIEIEVAPVLEGGNSIFMAFTAPQTGAAPLNVEFSTTQEFEIEIESDNGFRFNPGTTDMLVVIDLDILFEKIDFTMVAPVLDQDGVMRISETKNARYYDLVVSQLHDACKAGEDSDNDGQIDGN